MELRAPRLRRWAAMAASGVAMIAAGAFASPASAASLHLEYTCNYGLIGDQPLYVDIEADLPDSVEVGQHTGEFDITAVAETGGNTYLAIQLTSAAKLWGTGVSETKITAPQTNLDLRVPVTIDEYDVPPAPPLVLTARGKTPSLVFNEPGEAVVTVGKLLIWLNATRADGSVVAIPPGTTSEDDGDPNTSDIGCLVNPGQNQELARIQITEAADQPPSAPGKPQVTNITQTSADVSWAAASDDKGVAGYEVYLNGTKVKEVSGTSTTLDGLQAGTSYTVTVRAVDTAGQLSEASEPTTFTTEEPPPPDNPPSAPGKPSVTNITETSADVSWAPATDDNEVVGYEVYLNGTKVKDVTGTSTTLTGLAASTEYTVTVRAVDNAGQQSESSEPTTFRTQDPPPADEPPTRPGKPSVTNITETTADVSWAASNDDNGVAGYEVYLNGTKVADVSGTSVTLTGLSSGTTYSVTVRARDTAGQLSEPSEATQFTTEEPPPVDNPPSKPGKPVVSNVTHSTADVSWAASSDDNAVVGYEVFVNGSKVADVSGTSYTLTGLQPDTNYSVTVRAKDDAGQLSEPSDATSFRTSQAPDTQPPSKPGKPSATSVTSTSVTLTWTASTDNVGVAGYDVYRDGVKVTSVTGTTATIGGLQPDTQYKFKVQARDAAGNLSPFSDELTVRTAQPPAEVPVKMSYKVTGSTYIKGGNGSAPLNGQIDAEMMLSTGNYTADLRLDKTRANLMILGILPVTADIEMVPKGKATGNLTNGILTARQVADIKIPVSKALGLIPIAGGSRCMTASSLTFDLKTKAGTTFDVLSGGEISGTYTLPKLKNCGLLTEILSYLTAKPGNTIDLKLTAILPDTGGNNGGNSGGNTGGGSKNGPKKDTCKLKVLGICLIK